MPSDPGRDLDLALVGATGFTGRLTARHLAGRVPAGTRWALAGRRADALGQLRDELVAAHPAAPVPEVVVVDSHDEAALARLAGRTHVVVAAVGPYLEHGEPLLAACARAGTDYVDLVGEPEFVDRMFLAHHVTAAASGARIVHACGFDSVPHDLGALHAVQQLPDDRPITLRGVVRATGGVSGGTLASLLNAFSRLGPMRAAARERRAADPVADGRAATGVTGRPRRDPDLGVWLLPLPAIDQDVVGRSGAALASYGPDFRYSHYAGLGSPLVLGGALAGVGVGLLAAQVGPLRRLASSRLPQGTGPSDEVRAEASFTVDFRGDAGSAWVHTRVTGPDPYDLSGIALAEAALSLRHDDNPPSAGQVTTAQAMGAALTRRLEECGVTFEVVARG